MIVMTRKHKIVIRSIENLQTFIANPAYDVIEDPTSPWGVRIEYHPERDKKKLDVT